MSNKQEKKMGKKWTIKQTVEYWAEGIEADTKEQARDIFTMDLDDHLYQVYSETITEES